MKNNKKHPLTFFREEGEKRKAMFQKGGYKTPVQNLKKAQDGIETGNDMMINKPGSTGGYKKPSNPLALSARSAAIQGSVIKPPVDRQRLITLEPPMREHAMINSIYSRPSKSSNTVKGVVAGEQVEYTPEQLKAMGIQKRGGAVKTKKRK